MKKRIHRHRAINRAVVEQLYHVEYGADQIRLASGAAAAGGALLSLTGFASDVSAATFTVTNTNDNGAGSLRQAVLDAEAAGGADTIVFQAGVTGTIQLTSGHILIYDDLAINGPGAATLSVVGGVVTRQPQGQNAYSGGVFQIGPPVELYNPDRAPDGSFPIMTIDGLTITGGNADFGGNISNTYADLTISNCTVSNGTALYNGGGIFSSAITRVVTSTVSGNDSDDGDGGGIYSGGLYSPLLTVTDSTISGNGAYYEGGGIAVSDGSITIADSTISGNTGGTDGGGLYVHIDEEDAINISGSNFTGNDTFYADGAGLALRHTGGTVNSSTVSGNDAAANGGGLYLHNHYYTLDVHNVTVSGNTAGDAGGGVALDAENDGTSLRFVTITGNTAPDGSGANAYYADGIGNPIIENSVIAGNTGGIDFEGNLGSTVLSFTAVGTENATFTDGGGNLFGVAPLLGVLADNGGPTMTHLPLAGSPLINAADPAFVAPPALDQRGLPRISGGRADMGAVETVSVAGPEVPVPATSRTALAALAALIAAIGLTGLSRRMRGNAAAVAMLAAGLLTAGDPALAAKPGHEEVAFGTIASTRAATADNRTVEVALADGTRFNARRGHLRVIDRRSSRANAIESLSDVAAAQAVMVEYHRSARGRISDLRVVLFDTVEAARAHRASRRSAR